MELRESLASTRGLAVCCFLLISRNIAYPRWFNQEIGHILSSTPFPRFSRVATGADMCYSHSCSPNMTIYLAVYDTIPAVRFCAYPGTQHLDSWECHQTNRPYIIFVAREFIGAGTELTVDYDPASARSTDHLMAEDAEGMKKCFCGSKRCRDYVRMF